MSKTVVPAAANAKAETSAKAPVKKENPAAQADDPKPSSEEQDVIDSELEEGIVVDDEAPAEEASSEAGTSLAGDFSFDGALAAAAESAGSLISEAGSDAEVSFSMSNDDGDSSGTILLIGALVLVGGGIAALAGGGGAKNEAPVYSGAVTASGNEDTTIAINAKATDADGDALTYTFNDTTAHGTLTSNGDGTFSYVPDANYNGTDTFTVTATDPSGESATTTVTITINAVNDAPVYAGVTSASTDEDVAVTFNGASTDVDGDTLTYTTAGATFGTVTNNGNGTFTYTPNANASGTEVITVTASDGTLSATGTVTITVNAVNDAPIMNAETTTSLTLLEDAQAGDAGTEIIIDFDDIENNLPLTPTVSTAPEHGTIVSNANGQFYVPDANYFGPDSFAITVTDSLGAATTYTVAVSITGVNDAPTVDLGQSVVAITIDEDSGSTAFNVFGVDVDGDTLSYEVSDPTNGSVTSFVDSTGAGLYQPDPDFNGVDTFTVTITDGNGGTFVQTVTVTVNSLPETLSIDVVGPNDATPRTIDVGADDYILTENATVKTDVFLTNFSLGDTIVTTNATAGQYNFTTTDGGNDLKIDFNNNGNTTFIIIDDVLADYNGGFITSYAEAVAAMAEVFGDQSYVFMTFA